MFQTGRPRQHCQLLHSCKSLHCCEFIGFLRRISYAKYGGIVNIRWLCQKAAVWQKTAKSRRSLWIAINPSSKIEKKMQINLPLIYFWSDFMSDFTSDFTSDFRSDFTSDFSNEFTIYFTCDFTCGFTRDFTRDFGRNFMKKLVWQETAKSWRSLWIAINPSGRIKKRCK